MEEREIRTLIDHVKAGRLGRRRFVQMMVGLGLTAPMASQILASAGVAQAQTRSTFNPTKRGGGGALKVLWWQAATLLNPHFAVGTKDQDGSRIFYEPLAAFDPDGNLVPILAAEIPSAANGGVARDGKSVTWKLKRGVQWHDGKPFTADDVVFNWEYAVDPATAATTIGTFSDVERVEKVDSHTARVVFKRPVSFWAEPLTGSTGQVIPKHLFEGFKGGKSREAPTNLKPVGTGPYRFIDFKPGDSIRAEINPNYHVPNRPFFDTLEMKGGGDSVSATRAVIQTGEYDFCWNVQVEDEILKRMEQGGKGRIDIAEAGNIEHIQANFTDPWKEVDGERSSLKTTHPTLSDPAVRQALGLLVDRASIHEQIYGRLGRTSANFLNAPSRFYSKNTKWEFNVDKANQILDAAGWKRGADGIRAKDGQKLKFVYQSSINQPRQKTQAIVKQAAQKAGIDIEIKSVVASRILFVRRGQSRHVHEVLHGHSDVHDDHGTARSRRVHEPVHRRRDRFQGQQVAGPEHHALEERRVRACLQGRRRRDGPGQACGPLHQDERPRDPKWRRHPRAVAHGDLGRVPQAQEHRHLRLGLELLEPAQLAPGSLTEGR